MARAIEDLRDALLLRVADRRKRRALTDYRAFLRAASAPPALLQRLSAPAALRAARQARARVPAYRQFLERHGWRDDPRLAPAERLRRLPETDKDGYIKAYRTEQRCLDGRIPAVGTLIDESSGSSGTPYNWVRGAAELHEVHQELAQFSRYLCGEHVVTINGFSMGAWATGVNVGEAMRAIGIVKSTGPDIDKILYTLDFFGPDYTYIITGYPPFLKHLIDEGEARGVDWGRFRMFAFSGGEGMSEGLRAYLERRFQRLYSGYGASDLDIGLAGELPLTVWLRKHAIANHDLRRALFGDDPRLPMVFQFDPLDYYVETNDERELIVTINRLSVLSPRIRYNVHDAGGVIPYQRLLAILRDFRLDPVPEVRRPGQPIFPLPVLYLFGRSDSTLSYMGANIYPEDVEEALFADPDDARALGGFCLELLDVGGGEQRVCVHVEVEGGDDARSEALAERLRRRVYAHLLEANRDFRASVGEDRSAGEILVRLHAPGQGPFAGNAGRIKRRYILKPAPVAVPAGGA
jgi:phenylacetate-CoA ligase